jgi:hypothetical protein
MWILGITAAIAFILGEVTVLAAVLVLGISRPPSTGGRHLAPPVHRGTPESPGNATGCTQLQEGELGRWSFPSARPDPN